MRRKIGMAMQMSAFTLAVLGVAVVSAEALSSSGHAVVTIEKAEKIGFSAAAVEVMVRGTEAPDFYAWTNPAAHAQTANDDHGKPI
jgi:LDH2 family malate/lactate/ureidoglycolate dehydrogenase